MKGETHIVACSEKNKDFWIYVITEENGVYQFGFGQGTEDRTPECFEMTNYDYVRGKYQVFVFLNQEIKDISVEIDYEDDAYKC